jgi:hypothetical protein
MRGPAALLAVLTHLNPFAFRHGYSHMPIIRKNNRQIKLINHTDDRSRGSRSAK